MLVVLADGSQLDVEDVPNATTATGQVYRSKDGRSFIVLMYHQHNSGYRPVLEALLGKYNVVANRPFRKPFFSWPTQIVTAPLLGWCISALPSGLCNSWQVINAKLWSMMPRDQKGDWDHRVLAAFYLSRAVRWLHLYGLHFCDLSPTSFLVNPIDGHVVVLVNPETLAVPGHYVAHIVGTPWYMAPETVAGVAAPSISTDLHSLAVLLYQILLLRHPLMGPKIHSRDPEEDERLAQGPAALYIEHPTDHSNRPERLPFATDLLGSDLKVLFSRAFVGGLHTPSLRPPAAVWERALYRLMDDVVTCANPDCLMGAFVLVDRASSKCPWCGTEWPGNAQGAVNAKDPMADIPAPPNASSRRGPSTMSEPVTPSAADSSIFGVPGERRMPVYIVVDCGAASSAVLQAFEQGIRMLADEAMSLPFAVELMWLSIVAYGEMAEQTVPLTPLTDFAVPKLRGLGSISRLSLALSLLAGCIQREVRPASEVRKGDYKPQILVLTSSRPDRPLTAAELRRIGGQRCNLQFLGFRDQVSSDDFPPGFFVDGVSFTTPGLVEQIIRFWSLEDEFRYDDEMRQESILLAEIDPGHWVQLSMLPENVRLAAPSLPPPPAGFEISI